MPQVPQKIAVYKADGRLEGRFTVEAVERLFSLSLAVVRRDKRGAITCANLRPLDGSNPLLASCSMGQRYSYREHCGDYRAWAHKNLIQRQDLEIESALDLDRYVRAVFCAVPLSIAN
jgi:hypothetical protein